MSDAAPDATIAYGTHADQCIDLRHGGPGAATRPLLVLLHGGFWRPAYDRQHMEPMAQALATAGWSTANVEYRRVPGEPDVTLNDARAALDALAPAAEPSDGRLIVVGFSAGGHLALWLAATSMQRAMLAAVGLAPVADLRRATQLKLGNGAVDLFVGAQHERLASFDPAQQPSPSREVAIVHGVLDDTVPLAVSESYVAAHPATRLTRVPQAGHFALIDPRSGAWPAVVEELRRLGGRCAR